MTKKRKVGAGQEPSASGRVSEGDRGVDREAKAQPAEGKESAAEREDAQVRVGDVSFRSEIADVVSDGNAGEEIEKEIEREIEEEKDLAREYLEHLQRLQAEFSNYRKRARRENLEAYDHAKSELICRLLPVMDDLERAIESLGTNRGNDEALKGVRLIYGKLKSTLQAEGLEAIECQGKRFDPNFHEAVVVTQAGEGADNEIIKDFQKGYTFKGKLVRPSKVEVKQIQSDQGDD